MAEADTYIVLLRAPEEVVVPTVAECVAPLLGLHPSDAARAIASGHGVIARGVRSKEAQALSDALSACSTDHACLAESSLVDVPRPLDVSTLNFRQPTHLVLIDADDARHDVLWEAVLAVVAGRVEMRASRRRDLGEVLPYVGKRIMGVLTAPERHYADAPGAQITPPRHILVLAAGVDPDSVATYRVTAEAFSFACLGEALTHLSSENFRRLVAAVCERLPCVTHRLDGPVKQPGLYAWPTYATALDLERDLFRLAQLAWADRCV